MTDAVPSTGPGGHGDFLLVVGTRVDLAALRVRIATLTLPTAAFGASGAKLQSRTLGPNALAAWSGTAACEERDGALCIGTLDRYPRADWAGLRHEPERGAPLLDGSFAFARYFPSRDRVEAVTDRFRSVPLYCATAPGLAIVATDLRLIRACGLIDLRVSLQSIYHFLNFSYVPTPLTMYEGVDKVPPATRRLLNGVTSAAAPGASSERYWRATYDESIAFGDTERAAQMLRAQAAAAVNRCRPGGPAGRWGGFLSGGTDSSSIAGLLAQGAADPVNVFSIGFAEAGYDELGYADIAARHFGLNPHQHVVSAEETLSLIDSVLEAYDEPAGNASCIPTLACCRLAAAAGVRTMLGGDGGDEIFGGNERYRKDAIMQRFFDLPGPVKGTARAVAALGAAIDWRPWNRVRNFVRRGSLPNPDRFYTDDSFASEHYDGLLTADFRSAVRRESSLELMRSVYERAAAPSELNRLMHLDLEMTISDNDIVKVGRAARAAGLHVRFPYLDRELVEFTGRLDARFKVHGPHKRFLFKEAMRDLLPAQILAKKKQGFGLPIGVWFRTHPRFLRLIDGVLLGDRARQRGWFEAGRIEALVRRHRSGAWDHGPELWYLLMLELWLQRHAEGDVSSVLERSLAA